jgi:tRNA nucleotidyltransferase (CCA-adding enzyme)
LKKYIVGGFVRDTILGKIPKDKDWVVINSNIDEMLSLGFILVGNDFPVFIHPNNREEHALARRERKIGKGYSGFKTDINNVSLEEDLMRRDLTINSIAFNPETNEYIDPFNGISDLKNKILKHTSDAFMEDPLRVLRVARFNSRFPDFKIDESTIRIMCALVLSGEINNLTPERVWLETEKAMSEKNPSIYFNVLDSCGALEILFPELYNLKNIPQDKIHHPEGDCYTHSILTLLAACKLSENINVRFASLFHDLGKANSSKEHLPKHHGHEEESEKIVNLLLDKYKTNSELKRICAFVAKNHMRIHNLKEMRAVKIVDIISSIRGFQNKEIIKQIGICCISDKLGRLKENIDYNNHHILLKIIDNCEKLNYKEITTGYTGDIAKNKVRNARANVVKNVIKEFSNG